MYLLRLVFVEQIDKDGVFGVAEGREGEECRWVAAEELRVDKFKLCTLEKKGLLGSS